MQRPSDTAWDDAWLSTLTVLCVENDALTRTRLGQFLEGHVGKVILAADGEEGLVRFRAERPALVIADIQNPNMDGLSLAREIHRLAPQIPVIATTTFDDADHLRHAIEVGIEQARKRELESARAHEREAIGLLAGGVAHDFNNLLQTVVGNVELALGLAAPGSELQSFTEAALEASAQAIALSRRLTMLSEGCYVRVGAEAVPPILEAALAAALAGSATRVRVDLPVDLPSVVADREMLGRALEHLARNAREAMNDGGVLLVRGAVRVIADSDVPRLSAGSYCELVFQDEGPGVPAELHPKIFDAYYTTRPRGSERGMGLGLALVRAIVHHHRGSVSLAPPDARGAVFTILLPAHAP